MPRLRSRLAWNRPRRGQSVCPSLYSPKPNGTFVMQPRSAERQRALSWEPRRPRTLPDQDPPRGSVIRTSLRPRFRAINRLLRHAP
jgi:hypothetical protein